MLFSNNDVELGLSSKEEHIEFLYKLLVFLQKTYKENNPLYKFSATKNEEVEKIFYEDDFNENGVLKKQALFILKGITCPSSPTEYEIIIRLLDENKETSDRCYIRYAAINRCIVFVISDNNRIMFDVSEYLKNVKQRKTLIEFYKLYKLINSNEINKRKHNWFQASIQGTLEFFPDLQNQLLLSEEEDE
jgi:hypothetical protein